MPVSYTLAPGRYWFKIEGAGAAIGSFTCNRAFAAGSNIWSAPFLDNTGNNAIRGISSIDNNGAQGSGGLVNIRFQVGSANACNRLFICATPNCPAPVEFLYFNVSKGNQGNNLVWKTATELNASKFIIERSIDGINFSVIDEVNATNSINGNDYRYKDYSAPTSGEIYYRLKVIDIDGSYQYSEIRVVNQANESAYFSLYPVPTKKGQPLAVTLSNDEEVEQIELIDNLGRVIEIYVILNKEGIVSLEIPTETLASEVYFIRAGNHYGKAIIE